MFHELVNRNEDIRRLVEKGYAVAFDDNNYLVVRDIPYLDKELTLRHGAIVTKFVDTGQNVLRQENHQVFFAGSVPHGLDGSPLPNMGDSPMTLALSEASKDVVVQRSFSNKPIASGRYQDFFEKIETYVTIISGPAIEKYGATYLTFRAVEHAHPDSPFKIRDTLTSRAEIGDLAAKLKGDVVAIIGLGGTGSYVLDFMVRTPVREIRAFDHDRYYVHNAFRSPGSIAPGEAEFGRPKAEIYQARYDTFRTGLVIKDKFVDSSAGVELEGVTFAFVCVDKGSSRAEIFELLLARGIPFIDVGMGLGRKPGGPINGMLRATYYSEHQGRATLGEEHADLSDAPDDIYRVNIQTGELNALNACIAVLKFKQLRGYYDQEDPWYHFLFNIDSMKSHVLSKA